MNPQPEQILAEMRRIMRENPHEQTHTAAARLAEYLDAVRDTDEHGAVFNGHGERIGAALHRAASKLAGLMRGHKVSA